MVDNAITPHYTSGYTSKEDPQYFIWIVVHNRAQEQGMDGDPWTSDTMVGQSEQHLFSWHLPSKKKNRELFPGTI
jgi:hypothetical protein